VRHGHLAHELEHLGTGHVQREQIATLPARRLPSGRASATCRSPRRTARSRSHAVSRHSPHNLPRPSRSPTLRLRFGRAPDQAYGARRSKRTCDFSGVAAALTLWLEAGGMAMSQLLVIHAGDRLRFWLRRSRAATTRRFRLESAPSKPTSHPWIARAERRARASWMLIGWYGGTELGPA
jgi:hypothetical protein